MNLEAVINNFQQEDLKEYYLELLERVNARNLIKLCEFLQENANNMNLPLVNMGKSTEKNYAHAQKYFLKEKSKELTKPTEILSFAVSSILLYNGICTWPMHKDKPVKVILQWNFPLLDFVEGKLGKGVRETLENFWESAKDGDTNSKECKLMTRDVKKLI